MTLLFQVVDSVKIVERGFQIDPTNVFGFLVGGLILIILVLGAVAIALWKRLLDREKRLEELTVNITTVAVNATQVLDSLVNSVDKLPHAIDSHKGEIKAALKDSENAILRTIETIRRK